MGRGCAEEVFAAELLFDDGAIGFWLGKILPVGTLRSVCKCVPLLTSQDGIFLQSGDKYLGREPIIMDVFMIPAYNREGEWNWGKESTGGGGAGRGGGGA